MLVNNKLMVYKNWSFRFFIYSFISEIVLIYKTANFTNLFNNDADWLLTSLSFLAIIFEVASLFFLIISFIKKEKKDVFFYIPLLYFILHILLIPYFYINVS